MKKTYTKPSVEKREKLSHVAAGDADPVAPVVSSAVEEKVPA